MAQAVSRRSLTAEAQVRYRVGTCEICGGQSGTGTGFPRVLRFSTIASLNGKTKKTNHLHPKGCTILKISVKLESEQSSEYVLVQNKYSIHITGYPVYDFRLPMRCKRDLHSSGILRSILVDWYQSMLRKIPNERRPQALRSM
jgi:hypothetical protein